MNDMASMEQKTSEKKKAGFDRFMNEPLVRMAISQIPAGEHQDGLRSLLQEAYNSGFGNGQGDVIGDLLMSMLKDKRKEG